MSTYPVVAASAASAKPPPLPTMTEVREPTDEDIARIQEIKVQDFAIDVDTLQIPAHGNPLSDQEMTLAVESFINTFRRQ